MLRPVRESLPSLVRAFSIVSLAAFAIASTIGLGAQTFAARLYGQDDGLDNQAIGELAQDTAGHLWIGTENGLFRYDGARFVNFGRDRGLNDRRTNNVFIDRLGTLWVATRAGLHYFDGDRFHEVTMAGRSILASW
jgi:ligand-binding sensor domain-containing protein